MKSVFKRRNGAVFLAVAASMVFLADYGRAADTSAAARAATVIASSEAIAAAARAYHAKFGKVPQGGPNELVREGLLKEYPATTHSQSDFMSQPMIIDEGAGAALYVMYSITEPGDADLCRALNAVKMGLRPDASISETNLTASQRFKDAEAFSPTPAEVAGKDAFCLRITEPPAYAYFLRVMTVNP